MAGLFFYWLGWLGWIYTTFLMRKSIERTVISFILLSCLAVSQVNVALFSYTVNGSYLLLFFFALFASYSFSNLRLFFLMISSLTVSVAFVAFHLFEMYDPVWIIGSRQWLLTGAMCLLVLLMSDVFRFRVLTLLIGMCQGEWLCKMLLYRYSYDGFIGSFLFLDLLSLSLGMLVVYAGFERIIAIATKDKQQTYMERQ